MATPSRKLILDDIKTTCEGIAVAAGFKSNVATVLRVAKTWTQAKNLAKPLIAIVAGAERIEERGFNFIDAFWTVSLIGYIEKDADPDVNLTRINELQDDMIAALHADIRRGGNAISTKAKSFETDEMDEAGQESMVMGFEIHYERTTGST